MVLVWAALCCGPQITKGNWSQAAGTCRWIQAGTWAPLVVLGRSGRSLWPPERPWPLWRRPFACRPLLSGGLSYWDSPIRPLAELRPPVRWSPCQSIQSRFGGLGPRGSPRLSEEGSWSCLALPHLTQRAVDPAERRWAGRPWLPLLLWHPPAWRPVVPCCRWRSCSSSWASLRGVSLAAFSDRQSLMSSSELHRPFNKYLALRDFGAPRRTSICSLGYLFAIPIVEKQPAKDRPPGAY